MKNWMVVAAGALSSTVASANVWNRDIEAGSSERSHQVYDKAMTSGDEILLQATSDYVASRAIVQQLLQRAIASYRNAAQARPKEAEPYFRIGRAIYSFYFECGQSVLYQLNPSPLCPAPGAFDQKRAKEVIDAWDAFELRAPLDPRLSPLADTGSSSDFNVMFHRAVLHTHFGTKNHLVSAIADYENILARSDTADGTTLANLAETYMMVGRLDDAIDTYRQALRVSHSTETLYGLAVALDRDERSAQAKQIIVAQGKQQMEEFHNRVNVLRLTFYVPYGEQFYYFALASEAFGETDKAIDYWQKFIRSNAHPEYQPRAQAHLEGLLAARKRSLSPRNAR